MSGGLRDDEAGAVQIGPTDTGMVRLIVTTRQGVFELDFEPDEAREIAAELGSAADISEGARAKKPRDGKGAPPNAGAGGPRRSKPKPKGA